MFYSLVRRLFVRGSLALAALGLAAGAGAARPAAHPKQPPVIQEVSWHDFGLVVKASAPLDPQIFMLNAPYRFVVDLPGVEFADPALSQTIPINQGNLRQVRLNQKDRTAVRMVMDCTSPTGLQVMQTGDRSTLVIARAGTSHAGLLAMLKGEGSYHGEGQEIRTVWARETAEGVKIHLRAAKPLTYSLFEVDAQHMLLRVPSGHFQSILPRPGKHMAILNARTTPEGQWVLNMGLGDPHYQLSEEPSRDRCELTLSWTRVNPHRFPGRPLVVIDPGHGGSDPGALGPAGTHEKQDCLELALALQHALWQHKINAVLTRSADAELWLAPRLDLIEQLNADMFVSLHANSHTTPDSTGIETYWREPSSQAFAAQLQKEVAAALKRPDRGTKQERLYVLRNPRVPSLLLETGFISNPGEEHMLADHAFQARAAAAIADSLASYAGKSHGEANGTASAISSLPQGHAAHLGKNQAP